MIKMNKKILMLVILTLMVYSFWGAVAYEADFSQSVDGLRKMVETTIIRTANSGKTPDDGIPGGPPGIPG